jgi:single-stranded DNA-binding protein
MNLNQITVTGHIGQAEIRSAGSTEVLQLTLAISDDYKDKSGEWVKVTHWIRVEKWTPNEQQRNLSKGNLVLVSGKIAENSYEKDGKTQKYNLIRAGGIVKIEK